jgi:hypothetical protein
VKTAVKNSLTAHQHVGQQRQNKVTIQKGQKISAEAAVGTQLTAALDRTGVSNRDATYILHAAATYYGQDASRMSLSVSSIRRSRSSTVFKQLQRLKKHSSLTVHWLCILMANYFLLLPVVMQKKTV